MAYDYVTITTTDDGYTYSPSDVVAQGIYPDATVLFQDEADIWFGDIHVFYILDNAYGSHSTTYGEYDATMGEAFSLTDAFGSISQAGRYIYFGYPYHENNSIPIVARYSTAGAPTRFSCSPTLTDSTTTLTWSGASAGTNNTISSYEIQFCESSDGKTWGSWAALITVSSTATSGTKGVSASATYGNYRKFRIRTRGSAGSSYYSGWKESDNTVRRKWAPFGAWTDPTLTARTSKIRAVHLTELQVRVNTIRAFYGLSAYSFTTITARATKIAKWEALIGEIRTAIDGITTNHAAWNTLEAGKPRIAHITQIRSIIDNM